MLSFGTGRINGKGAKAGTTLVNYQQSPSFQLFRGLFQQSANAILLIPVKVVTNAQQPDAGSELSRLKK